MQEYTKPKPANVFEKSIENCMHLVGEFVVMVLHASLYALIICLFW